MSRTGFRVVVKPQTHCLVCRVAKHVSTCLQQVCIPDFLTANLTPDHSHRLQEASFQYLHSARLYPKRPDLRSDSPAGCRGDNRQFP